MHRTTPIHSSSQMIVQPKMSIVLMLRNSAVDPGTQEKWAAAVRPSEAMQSHFSPIILLPGGSQSQSRERDWTLPVDGGLARSHRARACGHIILESTIYSKRDESIKQIWGGQHLMLEKVGSRIYI